MKRLVLIVLLFGTITSVVNAQTEQGRWQVGAQVGNFSYQSQNGTKNFSGSISPSAGYFVIDNLLVGTGVPLSYSAFRFPTAIAPFAKSISTGYGLSPFARYYVGKTQLKPYAELAYSYSRSINKQTQEDVTGQLSERTSLASSTNLTPTVGVAYFFTNNVALNAGLSYNIQASKTEACDVNNNLVSFTSNWKSLSLGIGLQIFFGE
ncbi:outer membrane beta-barrel protein [Spirosoma sp. KUDC1026]|uniref:outer membrane beta-barrel protein n=1 Tax=Spirosoma sp. KUDC1026 TaxID=2745947 RepID=UPI00159B99EF|nr:outer membrane beta-barrel protein [Spirosoma sp. KUDC1026]QKZ14515.1 porin family protein [Spirosoma sp. KUDC1026]